jgi:NADH-quinone oxidoreductase subunit J
MDPVFTVAVGCALCVLSALAVVVLKKPVHTALGLLAHSLSMAAMYLLLDAQLMAMAQVLIYSGAIVVLFLIVVTLLPSGGREQLGAGRLVAATLAGGAVFVALLSALWRHLDAGGALPALAGAGPTVKEVGAPLFASLLLPFELTAPLLLAAIVTAIALWRRQEKPRAGGLG